jgi:hypothetical protein
LDACDASNFVNDVVGGWAFGFIDSEDSFHE